MASGVVSSENDELTVQVRDGDTYFTKTVNVDDAVCSSTISGETVYYETLAAALADLPTDDNTITLLKSIDADTTATLTITADNQTVYVGGTLPKYTYTVSGWQGSDESNADTLLADVSATCANADVNTVGSYTITVSGPESIDNYTITISSIIFQLAP